MFKNYCKKKNRTQLCWCYSTICRLNNRVHPDKRNWSPQPAEEEEGFSLFSMAWYQEYIFWGQSEYNGKVRRQCVPNAAKDNIRIWIVLVTMYMQAACSSARPGFASSNRILCFIINSPWVDAQIPMIQQSSLLHMQPIEFICKLSWFSSWAEGEHG